MNKTHLQQPSATRDEPTDQSAHFDIDASIVFQLGESLITDPYQALLELIKNSYDAGATNVDIVIESFGTPRDSVFEGAQGYLRITDDGSGMNRADILRGWLTISASPKREIKRRFSDRSQLPYGRFPLGDKGLGRLGVQRLGNNLEIRTRPALNRDGAGREFAVAFSWDAFRQAERLSDVNVDVVEHASTVAPGTTILVSDLNERAVWEDQKLLGSMQGRLAKLITPFKLIPSFNISLEINRRQIDLLDVAADMLRAALVEYELEFDGEVLRVSGRARLAFIRPEKPEEIAHFRTLVEADGGHDFVAFLGKNKRKRMFHVELDKDPGWFVVFRTEIALSELDGVELVGETTTRRIDDADDPWLDGEGDETTSNTLDRETFTPTPQDDRPVASPGPFDGRIYVFDFRKAARDHQTLVGPSDLRSYVKQLSGVQVYRDGFGVRVARDWLKMSEAFTSGGSYYNLRPANTLGYINIASDYNAVLEETTDREGFVDSPYYRNFEELLRRAVTYANEAQEFLRRGWTDYRKRYIASKAKNTPAATPRARAEQLVRTIASGGPAVEGLREVRRRLAAEMDKAGTFVEQSRENAHVVTADPTRLLELQRHAQERVEQISSILSSAASEFDRIESYLTSLKLIEAQAELVREDLAVLEERLSQVAETVSLGITAEALSHEIDNIIVHLAARARTFEQHLKTAAIRDIPTQQFVRTVKSSIGALRKQLSHLAPFLKYVRENREILTVGSALEDLATYYSSVFKQNQERIRVSVVMSSDFTIRMNRGKLTQILDNLVINSRYWLLEDLRTNRISEGIITLQCESPFVRVADNGRGIEPRLEEQIFDAFVSGKGAGIGRGLGLYVVQQLLESEGCRIYLSPQRNELGRFHVFEIDLSGALHDV